MSYFRETIDKLDAYVPGEQPPAGEKVIKLNTNENPYPPSPMVAEVLKQFDLDLLRKYSHPYANDFRLAVSKVFNMPADWILVGNGSDDLLTMLMRSVLEPGRKLVIPMPTYVLYRTLAQMQDAEIVEVPFDEEYNLPVDELIKTNGELTIIANPNSPSGTRVDNQTLAKLAKNISGLIVIDEAYTDFAAANALELVKEYDNVIVLRTLSKGYSMAGMRVGFAFANPQLIEGLSKVKDSYNVDAVACLAGAAALLDQDHKNCNAEKIKQSRKELITDLENLNFKVLPSESNFLLAKPLGKSATEIYESLKEKRIFVRYFNEPRLDDKLRITVGTDEENLALIDALKEILG